MKKIHFILLLVFIGFCSFTPKTMKKPTPIVLAYVTSWSSIIPDSEVATHINYASGHVTESFGGVRIDNEGQLKAIVALKKHKPSLKGIIHPMK